MPITTAPPDTNPKGSSTQCHLFDGPQRETSRGDHA